MSMMVSFVLSFFPRDVLDEILKLIESVSKDFPSYSYNQGIYISKKTPHVYLQFCTSSSFSEVSLLHL